MALLAIIGLHWCSSAFCPLGPESWLWPGIAEAKLLRLCTLCPGARGRLWPTIPRVRSCCTLSTHSMCHYCISPSWGHKSLWWVPRTQTLAAWKMCTCLHLRHWGQHHCECAGAAGPRYFPMGLIPDPGATATEHQCAKSGTKKDPLG